MATCKECLHIGVCGGFTPTDLDRDVFDYCREGRTEDIPDIEKRCNSFDDKSKYVEVKRGEWIIKKRHSDSENSYIDSGYYAGAFCSECDYCVHESLGGYAYPTLKTTNFCPNCGAAMRGVKNG